MTPDIPGSNPIFCPSWLAVLVVWQCPQSKGPVSGKRTLIQEMIDDDTEMYTQKLQEAMGNILSTIKYYKAMVMGTVTETALHHAKYIVHDDDKEMYTRNSR